MPITETEFTQLLARFDRLEANQARMEANQARMEANQARMEANQEEISKRLNGIEVNQSRMEGKIDGVLPIINKVPDLAEKIGEVKNWKQLSLTALSLVGGGVVGWWLRSIGKI